jgi:hypothetical protein
MPELSLSKVKHIRKEVVPFSNSMGMLLNGTAIIGNPDPVLMYLARRGEEAYRIMERNEPKAIFAARQNRDGKLLSGGSEILVGEGKTEKAKRIHAFVVAAFRRIEQWPAVEARMLDAIYWGWRPMELVWDTGFRFKRKTYWAIARIIDKYPEQFRFTIDRELVWVDPQTGEHIIYNRPGDELKWMICTYGSVDNPYGDGLYKRVWLLQYAKSRFFEMFAKGMERSMGIVSISHGFNRPAGPAEVAMIKDNRPPGEAMEAITDDIRDAIDYFNVHNIWLQVGGYRMELLTDVAFSEGWVGAMNYIDDAMSLAVATESLSFQEAQYGSRAQSVVHDRSGMRTAITDARFRDNWINEQLIRKLVETNYGDVDPGDMPKFRSKVRREVSLDQIKTFVDMGGETDADKVALEFSIPPVEDDTENVLKAVELTPGPETKEPGSAEEEVEDEEETGRTREERGGS